VIRSHAATILEFFRRFNEEDVGGLLELFADDATFSMVLYDEDLRGKAALGDFFQMHLANWQQHREWATSVMVSGNRAASELHFERSALRVLRPPGNIPSSRLWNRPQSG
jgi:ketosteroid isomerase-like protein